MLRADLLLEIAAHLLNGNGNDPATGSTAQTIGSTIEYIATSAAAILLLGLLLLIIRKSKRGDQTVEDSEAAVRQFLPM